MCPFFHLPSSTDSVNKVIKTLDPDTSGKSGSLFPQIGKCLDPITLSKNSFLSLLDYKNQAFNKKLNFSSQHITPKDRHHKIGNNFTSIKSDKTDHIAYSKLESNHRLEFTQKSEKNLKNSSSIILPKICSNFKKPIKKQTRENISLPKHASYSIHPKKCIRVTMSSACFDPIKTDKSPEMEVNENFKNTLSEHCKKIISQASNTPSQEDINDVLSQCVIDKMNININLKEAKQSHEKEHILAEISSKIQKSDLGSSLGDSIESSSSCTSDEEEVIEEPINIKPNKVANISKLENLKVEAIKIIPTESQKLSTIHLSLKDELFEDIKKAKEKTVSEPLINEDNSGNLKSHQSIKALKLNLMGDHIERKLLAYSETENKPNEMTQSEESSWLQNRLIFGKGSTLKDEPETPLQPAEKVETEKRDEPLTPEEETERKKQLKRINNKIASYIKFQRNIQKILASRETFSCGPQEKDENLEYLVPPPNMAFHISEHYKLAKNGNFQHQTYLKVNKSPDEAKIKGGKEKLRSDAFKLTQINISPPECPSCLRNQLIYFSPKDQPEKKAKPPLVSKSFSEINNPYEVPQNNNGTREAKETYFEEKHEKSKRSRNETPKFRSFRMLERKSSFGKVEANVETCLIPGFDDPEDGFSKVCNGSLSKDDSSDSGIMLHSSSSEDAILDEMTDFVGVTSQNALETILNKYDKGMQDKTKYKIETVKVKNAETLSQLNKKLYKLQSQELFKDEGIYEDPSFSDGHQNCHSPKREKLSSNESIFTPSALRPLPSKDQTSKYIVLVVFRKIAF